MATFAKGDLVEYAPRENRGYEAIIGAIGVVEWVTETKLFVTWISIPPSAANNYHAKRQALEDWDIFNFRKLGEVADADIR